MSMRRTRITNLYACPPLAGTYEERDTSDSEAVESLRQERVIGPRQSRDNIRMQPTTKNTSGDLG